MKSALEVWVPRDPSSGRPGAPTPKRTLGILNCRNVTHSFTNHPLPPGIEKKGHTHTHTSTHGNQKPGLPLQSRGQNW